LPSATDQASIADLTHEAFSAGFTFIREGETASFDVRVAEVI
jgi:hypothetical protein